MGIALQERMSLTLWWIVALGITLYLALGVLNTIIVVLE
jgi:hypothetical protein